MLEDAPEQSAVGSLLERSVMRPADRKAGRILAPSERVRAALARLSRDKWLPGDEVSSLAYRLACCTGVGNPWVIQRFCVDQGAIGIGLVRGELPVSFGHPEFRWTIDKLNRLRHSKDMGAKPELFILQTQLRNIVRYGWT